jgi:hypothetical protein
MSGRASTRPCAVDGCPRTVHAHNWCRTHYGRWRAHGDPLAEPRRRPVAGPADCLTCLDVAWLLEVGEHPDNVAARLRIQHNSLITHLHRHRRPDLVERIARDRQRTAA